jgi:hypothetical protein
MLMRSFLGSPVLVPLVGVSHEQVLTEKNGGVGQEQNLK